MAEQAVVVHELGKEYQLGSADGLLQYELLRDKIAEAASRIGHAVRRGQSDRQRARRFWALKGVNLEIPRGQVVGIIGRNGAGKSTFLKILSRITRPTEGYADLFGRVGSLLEVGTGFHPELTGRENIFLNGAILGMRKAEIERSFEAIVDFSGVAAFLDTPVKRFSSGMYVRLAFAVAAHLETEILLVDEVLAVGDAEFQRKCLGKMQSVVREGRTVLFVSHNMAAVKSLCQRCVWLDRGAIAGDGRVDDVIDAYLGAGRSRTDATVIPADAQRTGTGEARFARVELLDARGASTTQVYFGERFSVVLTFTVDVPIAEAVIGVGIASLDGVRVTSSYSTDGGAPGESFDRGGYRVMLDLDVTLLPRRYTLDVVIARTDGYEIDYVQQVLDFAALDVAREGPDGFRWATVHGYVRPAGRWHAPERSET
jgi:lipopolysaccharide transport system ATP-binding protein